MRKDMLYLASECLRTNVGDALCAVTVDPAHAEAIGLRMRQDHVRFGLDDFEFPSFSLPPLDLFAGVKPS